MNIPDLVNGVFEFGGSLFVLNHARVLFKHKQVYGVSIASTVFFFLWGLWNIYYYFQLSQFASWVAGWGVAIANLLWIVLMLYYRKYPGGKKNDNHYQQK